VSEDGAAEGLEARVGGGRCEREGSWDAVFPQSGGSLGGLEREDRGVSIWFIFV
jgi:hypothetical protein